MNDVEDIRRRFELSEHNNGWANPGPAGLTALAMACFIFFALLTGRTTHFGIGLMGIWLLGGFVIQVITGVMELIKGNTTGGNVFTFFSAFFMLATGVELIFKFFSGIYGWKIDAHVDGWAWLALSASLTLWAPAYLKAARSMLMIVLVVLPGLWIITFTDLGVLPKTWSPVGGWFLFAAGWTAIYTGAAIVLNTAFGRVILPIGAPQAKPHAVLNSKSA